jgi:hypothetical protein
MMMLRRTGGAVDDDDDVADRSSFSSSPPAAVAARGGRRMAEQRRRRSDDHFHIIRSFGWWEGFRRPDQSYTGPRSQTPKIVLITSPLKEPWPERTYQTRCRLRDQSKRRVKCLQSHLGPPPNSR